MDPSLNLPAMTAAEGTSEWSFIAADESATERLGVALARSLSDGTTVALCGTLGAGKTRLVQAIARASGVDPAGVVSPTFVLVHEYHGRRPIYHFDAYRVAGVAEFWDLGPDEYFQSPGLTLVEWADRVEAGLPSLYLRIEIEVLDATERRFTLRGVGPGWEDVLTAIGRELAAA